MTRYLRSCAFRSTLCWLMEIVCQAVNPHLPEICWRNYFKGIYIESEGVPQPVRLYFDHRRLNSRLNPYYHDTTNIARVYQFTPPGGRVNRFEHESVTMAVDGSCATLRTATV